MADDSRPVLVQEAMAEITRSISEWMARPPEQAHADFVAHMEATAERLNALPFEERLLVLIYQQGFTDEAMDAFAASIMDVTFAYEPPSADFDPAGETVDLGGMRVLIRMAPKVEQVHFTVTIGPSKEEGSSEPLEAILDEHDDAHGPCLKCPVPECNWLWELRTLKFRGAEDERQGRAQWAHHRLAEGQCPDPGYLL